MPSKLELGAMDRDHYDRSKRLGWFDIDTVSRAKVTVVGCGALGNEVVKDLALSGFKDMTIVDMDRVVGSNLNRCLFFSEDDAREGILKVEAVKRGVENLDRGVHLKVHAGRIEEIDEGVIAGSEIVLGCLDNIATRLFVNSRARAHGVHFIDGATDGLIGKVQVVNGKGPCIECGMNRSHMRVLNLRQSCTGEDTTFFEPRLAGEITTTSVVAAIQVREALKLVHGLHDRVLVGVFYYDGMRNESSVLELDVNPNCPHHGLNKDGEEGVKDEAREDLMEEVEKVG